MKILEIATEAPPYKSGISRLVGILADGLKAKGHELTVLTPKRRLREFKFSLIPLFRYKNFDIIHIWGPTPFLSDGLLVTNKGLNLIYSHIADISWKSEVLCAIYRKFHDSLAKNASTVVTLSSDYAASLAWRGLRKVKVIRPPFRFSAMNRSINELIKLKNSVFTVLYVGQLRPFKAVDVLIRVAAEMRDVNFIVNGHGYLRTQLEQLAHYLTCDNIRFIDTNRDEDLIKLYETSHVICLPSRNTTEAYGLVLLEGAMFGCVPVASNLLGVRENISMLRGSAISPNDPNSLMKILRVLSNNYERWERRASISHHAACEYAHRYSSHYYVKEHEEVFKSVLSKSD